MWQNGNLICDTRICKKPVYNIAFAIDRDEEGQTVVFLAGIPSGAVRRMMTVICLCGIVAKDFDIEHREALVKRNGMMNDWLEVTLHGFNPAILSVASLEQMIVSWLRREMLTNHVDRYIVDDFLNLTRHDGYLAITGGHYRQVRKTDEEKEKQREKTMANIYIKVPWYVAWHFRGRNEDHQLTEWEPVKFHEFEHEYRVLANNLRFIPEAQQSRSCYSQQAWKNILHGKRPEGGQIILQRDPKTWPTVNETAALTGIQMSSKHIASDYLCVEMPKEVWLNNRTHRTNTCYSLSYEVAVYFSGMLTDRFSYEYTQWMQKDARAAMAQGFHRKTSERQERYFVQYNFPVDIDPSLRESLRRQHTRFVERGEGKLRHAMEFGQESEEFMNHVGEHEEKRREEAEKQQKREQKKTK